MNLLQAQDFSKSMRLSFPIQVCVVPHLTWLEFLAPSLSSIPPSASSILPSLVPILAGICAFLHQSMRFLRRLKQFSPLLSFFLELSSWRNFFGEVYCPRSGSHFE